MPCWDCDIPGRKGTIDKVPAGLGYSLTIDGVVDGNVHWRHQTTGITVTGNQDTNIGMIEMVYIGTDQTPPTVSSHFPGLGDSGVILNSNITATFSEDVVAASVNKSSCTLYENGAAEPIPYELSYNASVKTVTLDPNNNPAQNTTYQVTITKEVGDLNIFSGGTPALADEVNDNFQDIKTEVNDNNTQRFYLDQ